MVVGRGVDPSQLRPNLNDRSSTTSDDNWAQILKDVDPPSHSIVYGGTRVAMRPQIALDRVFRKQTATLEEQIAMDDVFERVFNMNLQNGPQAYTIDGRKPVGYLTGAASPMAGGSNSAKTPDELDMMVDAKREAMYNCKSDQELLKWAMREVFCQLPEEPASSSPSGTSDKPSKSKSRKAPKELHPGIYARVVATLMVEFRERYNNPHLAIAIFDFTRRRSILSYVTGCTAPSYNELMRTYWNSFRDLQAVLNIAEEMRVNGVAPDSRTQPIATQIREEILPRTALSEGGLPEVYQLLNQLDILLRPKLHSSASAMTSSPRDGRYRDPDDDHPSRSEFEI
ncbi:hypothetical protein BDV93DRAFT_541306 [Ceratobasidium sp. AG-I]|nr:hypothetical protein BDV93DRAFT_541306 [Ceratobasidium sp. AG-I]